MENRAHALIAGIFTIVFGIALAAAYFWFSGKGEIRKSYLLITEKSISGLNNQAAVRYRGVEVGKVKSIKFDEKHPKLIQIRIAVDEETPVTRGTFGQLKYRGITGLAYVELNDDGRDTTPLPTSKNAPGVIPLRASLLDEVSASGQELIGSVTELTDRLNMLLNDESQAYIGRILANIEAATARLVVVQDSLIPVINNLPNTTQQANKAFNQAERFFSTATDTTNRLKESIKSFDQVAQSAEKLGATGEKVGDEILTSTLPQIRELVTNLNRTSRNLDRISSHLEDRPQSIIFGKQPSLPGPGEQGFAAPKKGPNE